jgi:hypothetical protein
MFGDSEKSDGCILCASALLVTGNGNEKNGIEEVAGYRGVAG